MPTLTVDRAPSSYTVCNSGDRSGLHSDTRYTSNNNRRRDVAELRPFLFNPVSDNSKYQLPPIQNVMMTTPTASPSPLFDSYCSVPSPSPISSIASSPTPIDEEDVVDDEKHQQIINIRRKGSIASILNSDPELRQLDEEESKCNYQSHFIDNYSPFHHQTSLKRGRPRQQDHIETVYQQYPIIKKQRLLNNARNNNISQDFDCVQQQACQSSSLATSNNNYLPASITNESPRAAKGLRHFSKQVCDKVAEKGVTTYNEV
jgi:hypothetical protein